MVFSLSVAAFAQTASQVTPGTFEPPAQNLSGSIVFTGEAGVQAPAGSDKLFITLSDVVLKDGLPQMAEANAALRARLTGKSIPVSEIFAAVSDLEAAYANAGYILARVVLPAQSLRNGGVLQVVVVNGFVEGIDASALPPEVRGRIEELTEPLVGKPGLRLPEIERQLLLAGDTYGVALGSALTAGAQPGGTVVVLESDYKEVTGFIGFDNVAEDTLGDVALNAGIELNGLLSMGETIYGRISGSPKDFFSDEPQYRTLALGAVFPIGDEGLTLNFEATKSQTTPDAIVPTTSEFDRYAVRLFYPWIRSRGFNLSTQLSLDWQKDEQELLSIAGRVPIYEDKLTVLRASGDIFRQFDNGAVLEAGAVFSQGLDALGAKRAGTGTVPLSRQGADAVFSKLVMSLRYQQLLAENLAISVSGRLQSSFGDPLLTSEQLSIAGANELSTFDAGSVQGDNGWVVRTELSSPRNVNLGQMPFLLSPYVFGAYGIVNLEQPTVFEQAKVKAASYGVGLELVALQESRFRSGSIRIEYGRGDRDDNQPDGNRFSIIGTYRF